MKEKRIHPIVKIFFASAVFVSLIVVIILAMGYRYITYPEGKFIGIIKNNVPYEGHIKYATGDEADLYNGMQLKFENGNVYEGDLKNIVADGHGKLTFAGSGNVYEGMFLNNQMSGKGTLTYGNGNSYEGDFVNGKREGNGVETIKDKTVYTGEFKDDKYNGHGVLEFLKDSEIESSDPTETTQTQTVTTESKPKYDFGDPDVPETEYTETEPTETIPDNSFPNYSGGYEVIGRYEGDFKDGAQHGSGKQFFSNGDYYEGDYLYGRRTGDGTYIWKTGEKYVGGFCDDLPDTRLTDENGLLVKNVNGNYTHVKKAIYTKKDGTVSEEYFEAGKQVNIDE